MVLPLQKNVGLENAEVDNSFNLLFNAQSTAARKTSTNEFPDVGTHGENHNEADDVSCIMQQSQVGLELGELHNLLTIASNLHNSAYPQILSPSATPVYRCSCIK